MSKASQDLVERLRKARDRLAAITIADPALAVCVSGLGRVADALGRPLSVVILGEYNSGKTSVADLLIGDGVLPTSVISNTRVPVLMTHAERPALYGVDEDDTMIRVDSEDDDGDAPVDIPYQALRIELPIQRLRGYRILDTPSMASPDTFVQDADIVIWCTVATRAWTENERATWSGLPPRCRRDGLLVVTNRHSLQGEEDERHVMERLRSLTEGLFRDVVLVEAAGLGIADEDHGAALRARVDALAEDIGNRRARKAEKIVRRLGRLSFHEFAREEVRPEIAALLAGWETGSRLLLEDLRQGRKSAPTVIEELLRGYAVFAEKLLPGVVTGDAISAKSVSSRALTKPIQWPEQGSAVVRLVEMLVSDLTGLLRMLSGTPKFMDPAVRAQYQAARGVMLALADLDGAFEALGRMVGSSEQAPSAPGPGSM